MLVYGERKYGEKYSEGIQESTGKTYQDLADCKWVASRVQFSYRNENLSWTHHRTVAPLDPEKQAYYLDLADKQGMSVAHLIIIPPFSYQQYAAKLP